MTDPLLLTKLNMPVVRSELVTRPRLLARLNAGLWQEQGFTRKLTLVSAPAGYGKTTLAAEWLRGLEGRAGWLTLDESDNDPVRFLGYLIAALRQVRPEFGAAVLGLLQSPQAPPMDVLLTMLVNEVSGMRERFILALDDYHTIHTPAIHHMLAFLLDHLPERVHLALITREDPLLPLARLRAGSSLQEIRQEDLLFTREEAADFLGRVMGLDLSAEQVDALERRTEGWIAGLQLAALSLRGAPDRQGFIQAFTGSSRYILDYLMEEVFNRQPAGVQDFLLKTSLLERLSGPLCDALTGGSNGQELLAYLEQANLFILPLDAARTWYRYHHLFQELLRHRLRTSDAGEEVRLYQLASRWYEAEGHLQDAVQYALAGQDWPRAAALIGRACGEVLMHGEVVSLLGWFEKLPAEITRSDPQLCLAHAWVLQLTGHFEPAAELLELAERLTPAGTLTMGEVATAQAYLARAQGDNLTAIEKSELALSLLPENELVTRGNLIMNLGIADWHEGRLNEARQALLQAGEIARKGGNSYGQVTTQLFLARVEASQGGLHKAENIYREMLAQTRPAPIYALAHYDLSDLLYEWNDLEKARQHQIRGLELSRRIGSVEFELPGHLLGVLLSLGQGDINGAQEAAAAAEALAGQLPPTARTRCAVCHAHIALAKGDVEEAAHIADQLSADVDLHSLYRFARLTRARVLLAQGKKGAAWEELQTCAESASRGGWGYALVAIRVLQALAARTPAEAQLYLVKALKMAQPEGYLRTFMEAGEGLVPLLQEAARRGIEPEYVGRILAALAPKEQMAPAETSVLAEHLSGRELEVLRLVTAGLSNREIAGQLVISAGTAKTHIHNICGKLGVRNRTEAVARAKEIGLV